MGLFDFIDFIETITYNPKKEAEKMRKGGWDEEFIESIFGEEACRDRKAKVDAEYRAEQKRKKAQHRQYLLDHKACSTCYHYSFPDCYYYATEHYYRGGQPERVDDPDRTTCKYYKRDCSK